MDTITIEDLELFVQVGVPDEERATPQRLLITVVMHRNLAPAATADDLALTIDYFAVSRRVATLGASRPWRLIETLAGSIATLVLSEFKPESVDVTVKKFILPDTRWVAVKVTRSQ